MKKIQEKHGRILRRIAALVLVCGMAVPAGAVAAQAADYSDVPADSWAVESVAKAGEYGLMEGVGEGRFGYGATISRSEFVTVLVRLFKWSTAAGNGGFTDVPADRWDAPYIAAAVAQDVIDAGGAYRGQQPITREEMAVMLVRALGYKPVAAQMDSRALPFTDVKTNRGYIAIAYDIGMTTGTSDTTFAPAATAAREQAAAMLVRIYEKYYHDTTFTTGFYAFSSYSQLALGTKMDAVSAGWSRLALKDGAVTLQTTSEGGNAYCVPSGYQAVTDAMKAGNTPLQLDVYMDDNSGELKTLLASEALRAQAVEKIVNELTVSYKTIGYNPYSGVTIDFECLRSASRADLTLFLQQLAAQVHALDKTVYVAVHPALSGEAYYDGYDYRAIGALADKVILMAYDYNATTIPASLVGSTYHQNTALTPIAKVYDSLRLITDSQTGVQDRSKLVLGLSTASSIAWRVDADGNLQSGTPFARNLYVSAIYDHLKESGAAIGYSQTYHNPYLRYTTADGQQVFLWYEDSRSIADKISLAKLFGVNGVSYWRLGEIPSYQDAGLYYDVASLIQ